VLSDLTLFAVDTPASLSPRPVAVSAPLTRDICGHTSPHAFAYYDPTGRCLRMSQGTFDWDSQMSSPILPASGLMRNGSCYQRQLLVPRTSATGCSWWPTPEASDGTGGRRDAELGGTRPSGTKRAITLGTAVMWPTPRAERAGRAATVYPGTVSGTSHARQADGGHGDLEEEVARRQMWPTPTANNYECEPEVFLPRREREKNKGRNGNGFGLTLGMAARLWPTPTSRDWKGQNQRNDQTCLPGAVASWPTPTARLGDQRGPQAKRFFDPARSNDLDDAVAASGASGSLNPNFVEWLMGLPKNWTVV